MAKKSGSPRPSRSKKSATVAAEPQDQNVAETPAESPASVAEVPAESPVAPVSVQKERMMTLNFKGTNKSGRNGTYTNPALRFGIRLPKSAFGGTFPQTIEIEAAGLATLSPEDAAKAQERAEKRAAKGLKPKPTLEERQATLAKAQEKVQARLQRINEANARLAAKMAAANSNRPTEVTDEVVVE